MEFQELCPLDPEKVYISVDKLTLDTDQGPKTQSLGAWINDDPKRIHQLICKEKILQVDKFQLFDPLISKLRRKDPIYYKMIMGLSLIIDFPGYSNGIKASIPFENDPVAFYKWYRKGKHEDKVYLSRANEFRLIQKVYMMEPKMVLKSDIQKLN